nr:hypothetical protein [Tanacetum cinerariifolium]
MATNVQVFNYCLTSRTSRYDQTKINILYIFHVVVNCVHVDYVTLLWWDFLHCIQQKKDQIQYHRFTKLITADLMKNFSSILQRLEEDYHSIKDDILLVSVYTMRNVTVRGMLISDEFFIDDVHTTKDYKEYMKVFVGIKGGRIYVSEFVDSVFHDHDDDSSNRIESRSHKEHPKMVVDDDENEKEKKDNDNDDDAIHKNVDNFFHDVIHKIASNATHDIIENNLPKVFVETVMKTYIQNNVITIHHTTGSSTTTPSSVDLQYQLYLKMKRSLQDQVDDPELWDVLKLMLLLRGIKERKGKRHQKAQNLQEALHQNNQLKDLKPMYLNDNSNNKNGIHGLRNRMEAMLRDMMSNEFKNAEEYAYHLEQSTNYIKNQIV